MRTKTISLLLLAAVVLGGCSSFSKSARQQRAYEKYVEKSSRARAQRRALFRQTMPKLPPPQPPGEVTENIEVGSKVSEL